MVLEKQSLCNITSGCTSTNEGAEAAGWAADCGVQWPLLKVTLHTSYIASPATERNKGQKERTCSRVVLYDQQREKGTTYAESRDTPVQK